MMENEKRELDLNELDQVAGGTRRMINTNTDSKAQIRSSPEIVPGNRQDSLVNGTYVDTVDDTLIYDPISGRNFVEITYTIKGVEKTGYVAASIVGLKR